MCYARRMEETRIDLLILLLGDGDFSDQLHNGHVIHVMSSATYKEGIDKHECSTQLKSRERE